MVTSFDPDTYGRHSDEAKIGGRALVMRAVAARNRVRDAIDPMFVGHSADNGLPEDFTIKRFGDTVIRVWNANTCLCSRCWDNRRRRHPIG